MTTGGPNPERQQAGLREPVHHVHVALVRESDGAMVFQSVDDPNTYTGRWGSISIDVKGGVLRVHDGVTPGGVALAPLYATSVAVLNSFPFVPKTEVEILQEAAPVEIVHNLGRVPLVQVIDTATMTVVSNVEIKHLGVNSVELTAGATGTYSIKFV